MGDKNNLGTSELLKSLRINVLLCPAKAKNQNTQSIMSLSPEIFDFAMKSLLLLSS